MAETEPKPKRFAHIEPNRKAYAMGFVADEYPDKDIRVKVAPIRNGNDAKRALAVATGMSQEDIDLYVRLGQDNPNKFSKRCRRLGKQGASSLVSMEVFDGDFDFGGFYEEVNQMLEDDGFQVHIPWSPSD